MVDELIVISAGTNKGDTYDNAMKTLMYTRQGDLMTKNFEKNPQSFGFPSSVATNIFFSTIGL